VAYLLDTCAISEFAKAATAIVHGLAVVTRNTSDIARTGAPVIDPW
jgi:predicted nucleic acid-binding protein